MPLFKYDCGVLAASGQSLPPSAAQVEACARELTWTNTLLSAKLFGTLPDMDNTIREIIQRSVILEAFDESLSPFPTASLVQVNKCVKQLWQYACATGRCDDLESDSQDLLAFGTTLNSLGNTSHVCCLTPSSNLLQTCVALATTYASMAMTKNARWNRFYAILKKLADGFASDASKKEEEEAECVNSAQSSDDFAAVFQAIASATEVSIVDSPVSSYLREAACYLLFAGVVARSRYGVPGKDDLNKGFREMVRIPPGPGSVFVQPFLNASSSLLLSDLEVLFR